MAATQNPTDLSAVRSDLSGSQEVARVNSGIQCPECYGVNTFARTNRFSSSIEGFGCQDCGCQWQRDCMPFPNALARAEGRT